MEIPLDSSIAMSTTLQREQNKVEQERMKRLVLDYDTRQEEADKQGSSPFLSFSLFPFPS
jgi:regulator of nonsense transcripts 2